MKTNVVLALLRAVVLGLVDVFGSEQGILVSVADDKEYVDGNPTGKVLGTKYTVVLPQRQYDSVTVKVPGTRIVTQENIEKAGGSLPITFKGFKGTFYFMNGSIGLSCKADAAVLVETKPKA